MVTRTSESKVDYFDPLQGFGPLLNLELSDPTPAETSAFDLPHTYPVEGTASRTYPLKAYSDHHGDQTTQGLEGDQTLGPGRSSRL